MRRARRHVRPRRTFPTKAALVAAFVALLIVGAGSAPASSSLQVSSDAPSGPRDPYASFACGVALQPSRGLGEVVEAQVAGKQGTYGVAALDLDTGRAYLRHSDERFPSASVYKLAVLYETWRQVELGRIDSATRITILPEDATATEPPGSPAPGATLTIEEAVEAMITISSNSAARALLRVLGRDSVNAGARWLGLRDTVIPTAATRTGVVDGDGDEVAATSPRDVLCLLTLVANGQLLGREPSAEIRQVLFRQRVNDRLPALLPPGTRVAHKTGELTNVRNDVGIVYAPGGTYVLAVLTKDVNEDEAALTIAQLSRRVHDHLTSRSGGR